MNAPKFPHGVYALANGRFGSELSDPWQEYERLKRQWQYDNPGATPAEYEAAVRKIAQECGV